MTNHPTNPDSQRGLDALSERYREGLPRPDRGDLDRGLAGVRARMALRRGRHRQVFRWSLAGAGLAASLVLVVMATAKLRSPSTPRLPPALSYQIDGGEILQGGYLREAGHSGMRLRFNEGSQVAFDPGARGRLRSVDQSGARVAVDHGQAEFQIRKDEGRRWLVEAGPFLVTVKGTVFSLSWDPRADRFELRLRRGQVSVSTPTSKREIDLESGQRLVVNLAKAETVISEDRSGTDAGPAAVAPPAVVPSEARPAVTSPRSTPRATGKAVPASPTSGGGRWAEDFAEGRWDRIVKDAEATGIEAILDKASLEDLFVLADAARYRHRPELARAALLAERRRFPDAPRTLAATFLLGRVEESREGRRAQAIAWYDEYLAHSPTGALAAEALGRKMMLTAEIEGPAKARPLAEEYLRRFPNGSYQRSARLLKDPSAPGTP